VDAAPPSDPGTLTTPADGLAAQLTDLYPALRRFAACTADRDLDPDELVQEAFVRIFDRWGDTPGLRGPNAVAGPDDLGAYARRTIVNLVANERRSRGRARAAWNRQTASAALSHPDYPSHLAAVLDQVSPTDRALLLLVDVEGMSTGDAAAMVGITPVSARARLSRARRRLRSALADQRDAEDRKAVSDDDH
jgi:RNA polymerase sigma factor (sigma-70 family)